MQVKLRKIPNTIFFEPFTCVQLDSNGVLVLVYFIYILLWNYTVLLLLEDTKNSVTSLFTVFLSSRAHVK